MSTANVEVFLGEGIDRRLFGAAKLVIEQLLQVVLTITNEEDKAYLVLETGYRPIEDYGPFARYLIVDGPLSAELPENVFCTTTGRFIPELAKLCDLVACELGLPYSPLWMYDKDLARILVISDSQAVRESGKNQLGCVYVTEVVPSIAEANQLLEDGAKFDIMLAVFNPGSGATCINQEDCFCSFCTNIFVLSLDFMINGGKLVVLAADADSNRDLFRRCIQVMSRCVFQCGSLTILPLETSITEKGVNWSEVLSKARQVL
ncbi:MAG: hypothetical protein WC244_04735 [Patescibacteria group bacterium]|jgi:hypothetical protein